MKIMDLVSMYILDTPNKIIMHKDEVAITVANDPLGAVFEARVIKRSQIVKLVRRQIVKASEKLDEDHRTQQQVDLEE